MPQHPEKGSKMAGEKKKSLAEQINFGGKFKSKEDNKDKKSSFSFSSIFGKKKLKKELGK